MNAKAIIEAYTDFPTPELLRYSMRVAYISSQGGGYLGSYIVDAEFLESDTIANVKTKIRNAIVADAASRGYTVTTANVSSIYQI